MQTTLERPTVRTASAGAKKTMMTVQEIEAACDAGKAHGHPLLAANSGACLTTFASANP